VDRASKQITVEGGALLRDIENALEAAGLALPMVPSLDDATIGGVLATGTHGSGTGKAVLSTRVERMRLVSGMGELLQVSRTHNADLFPATLVNLGALGVLVEVTLQAVDWFHVHEIQEPRDATQWLGGTGNDLQRFFEENPDFAKVWLQPLVNQSLFFSGRHTDVARRNNPSVWSTQVRIFGFELLQLLMSYVPSWTPSIMDFLMNKLHVFEALDRVGRPDEVFHVNVRIAQHAECEFSVPLHHCDSFVRAISRHIRLRAPFFNYVLEARPVKGDDIWLSPDYGGTRCHVSVLLYNMGSDSTHRLFRDVEGISARFDGRPHWGKWFYSSAAELSSLFPKWTDWMAARKRLDPHNVFLNPLLERVFGLLHSQTPLPRVRELLGLP
jgi:L-gulonolactone oxidase